MLRQAASAWSDPKVKTGIITIGVASAALVLILIGFAGDPAWKKRRR